MKVLVMLKSPVLSDVAVTAHSCLHDGTRVQITQNGLPSVELDPNQVLGLLSALNEHFKVDPPNNGQFEFIDCGPIAPKDGPPEDPVALLCAAARKWAKWDARYQAFMTDDLQEMGEHDRLDAKRHKWMTRTLSYGHHLLAEPVKERRSDDVWTPEQLAQLAALNKQPLEFNRICIDPAAEMKRLDTLVQQLCARVAHLEEAGG